MRSLRHADAMRWRKAPLARTARSALAGCVWIAIAAAPSASAGETPAEADFVTDLPVITDGVEAGYVSVGIVGDEPVFVDAEAWRRFAETRIAPELVAEVLSRAEDGRLRFTDFEAAGLRVFFDPRSLGIVHELEGSQRFQRLIDGDRLNLDPNVVTDGGFSAHLNVLATQDFIIDSSSNRDDEGRLPLVLGLDGAMRLFGDDGFTLESSVTLEEAESGDASDGVERGFTRLVYDDVPRAIRFSAGDLQYETVPFQGGPELLGLSAERRYSLQPGRDISSSGDQSFVLSSRSLVRVFINGTLRQTLRLDPGRYSLRDFSFVDGRNDTVIEIEDSAGRVEVREFSVFLDSDVLEKGATEFSANAGFERDTAGEFNEEYDFETINVTGFFKHGVTDAVTLGAQYQGRLSSDDDSLYNGGLYGAFSTPIGVFVGVAAGSESTRHGSGYAASAQWEYDFPTSFGSNISAELLSVYTSDSYLELGAETPINPFELENFARVSLELPFDVLGSFSYRHSIAQSPERVDENAYGVTLARRFGRVATNFRFDYESDEIDDQFEAFLSAAISLGPRQNARVSHDTRTDRSRMEYNYFSRDVVNDVSGSIALEGNDDAMSATGDVRYNGNRFVTDASVDFVMPEISSDDTELLSQLRVGTALVYAGGQVALGRPVRDSFALVGRHDTLEGAVVEVNPSAAGVVAKSDALGPAVVPNLRSYQVNRIDAEVSGAPFGYDLGDASKEVFPYFRSGYSFEIGSEESVSVAGVALDESRTPIALVGGEVQRLDGDPIEEATAFTNAEGRFFVTGLRAGWHRLILSTTPKSVLEFEVPDGAAGLVDVGPSTINRRSGR